MRALILGISGGAGCIAYCAPVLVSYLLGRGCRVSGNFFVLFQFLAGRFLGYMIFAMLAWLLGRTLVQVPVFFSLFTALIYLILGILLFLYGFIREQANGKRCKDGSGAIPEKKSGCLAQTDNAVIRKIQDRWPVLVPMLIGLLAGLNFCPPFLLAFTDAASQETLPRCLMFFALFFVGTSIFFLPFAFIGIVRRYNILSVVGKLATGLIGIYYFYAGLMLLINLITIR
ncbi:MAG: sulfite exporter TauE/SafE family protein [Kiritimatiellaeota bacterium]|nr:sulfite exporter TauE/SafE family protein [Kiritimatiellota bacterium]